MGREVKGCNENNYASYLRLFLAVFWGLALFFALVLLPWSAWWIAKSGDNAIERVVETQAAGHFVIFGSGISQDFVDYKLRLYAAVKPVIAAVGSSRVMQFRGDWFRKPFVNLGGAAGNLSVLNSTVNAMIRDHRPKVVLLGLDFWWFLPQWEKNPEAANPPASGSYNYGLENLKKPWQWLWEGKIGAGDFFRPLLGAFGHGFRTDRFGIMAQQYNDGFGPDGSWNYTGEITGQKPPFDFRFRDTILQVARGIKAFYHAGAGEDGPARTHLEVLVDMILRLKTRGVKVFTFIPPLAPEVFAAMKEREKLYPHLFRLKDELEKYGIEVMDFSNPRDLGSSHCEFIDGFHGGEITYARVLRRMAARWPTLMPYVKMNMLDKIIYGWSEHASVHDPRITDLPETDFMRFGCPKKKMDN